MVIVTENIYENYDATRGKSEKEPRDFNATRIRSLELTGADGVKTRSSRAASVCLMLLCVLLLTAVIVLSVMFTLERHKSDNLTGERKRLIYKNDNLTDERNRLISKNDNLTNERNQLIYINKNVTIERDQLKQDLLHSLDGWVYYQSSLYFISSESKSWNESRRYCRDRGADLIIINNPSEQEFVFKISGSAFVWIGLSKVDGGWKWVDGSAVNSGSWGHDPNLFSGQNCAGSYYSRWYVYFCNYVLRWICEKRIF